MCSSRHAFRFREILATWVQLHSDSEQVRQPSTDSPQVHTFYRANWNGAKDWPTCDENFDQLPLGHPFPLDPSFPVSQSPLPPLPFPFFQHRSALCPLIPHLKQVPLKATFALALDCKQFVSIALLILLVLIRVVLLFHCFANRNVRANLRHIRWDRNCDLCGGGSVRVCTRTWRDCTNFPCRMAHISHVSSARCRACCNMLSRISEKVRYCGCKSTAPRISFSIMCLIALAFTSSSSSAGLPR